MANSEGLGVRVSVVLLSYPMVLSIVLMMLIEIAAAPTPNATADSVKQHE